MKKIVLLAFVAILIAGCSNPSADIGGTAVARSVASAATIDTAKVYKIRNAVNNTCLDVYGNGAPLSQVVIWINYSSPTQVWRFTESDEAGYYYIYNLNGTYTTRLDVQGYGVIGSGVVTYSPYYSDTQKWKLISTGDGYYKIYNKAQGSTLDCLGNGAAKSGVVVYFDYSSATQSWKLEEYAGI